MNSDDANEIEIDFSSVPSPVGLLVAQNVHTARLGRSLVESMGLDDEGDRQMMRAELVGEVAAIVDRYA